MQADLDGGYDRQLVHLLQVLLHAAPLDLEHILVRGAQLKGLQRARQPATTPGQPSAMVTKIQAGHSVSVLCKGAQLVCLNYCNTFCYSTQHNSLLVKLVGRGTYATRSGKAAAFASAAVALPSLVRTGWDVKQSTQKASALACAEPLLCQQPRGRKRVAGRVDPGCLCLELLRILLDLPQVALHAWEALRVLREGQCGGMMISMKWPC